MLTPPKEPAGAGRGIWLGPALWKEVIRQLESQAGPIGQMDLGYD